MRSGRSLATRRCSYHWTLRELWRTTGSRTSSGPTWRQNSRDWRPPFAFGVLRAAFSLRGTHRDAVDAPSTQGVHLRPWGDDHLLLLWDYWHADHAVGEPPVDVPAFDGDLYPEVCLRGLAGFIPGLRSYVDGESERPLIDGGYYTQTPENRPLIGPGGVEGYFINGAFAGFGLMAAEAAGELCAAHVLGNTLPSYASAFVPARYADPAYPLEELVARGGGSI